MGFAPFTIFYFLMHLTFADGTVEVFAPGFTDKDQCQHFMADSFEAFTANGATVEIVTPECQEFEAFIPDGSV